MLDSSIQERAIKMLLEVMLLAGAGREGTTLPLWQMDHRIRTTVENTPRERTRCPNWSPSISSAEARDNPKRLNEVGLLRICLKGSGVDRVRQSGEERALFFLWVNENE